MSSAHIPADDHNEPFLTPKYCSFKEIEYYKINMNALIDLNKCREYMIITIGDKNHQIKLAGTLEDPYFCGKDVCQVLGYKDSQKALFNNVKLKHKNEFKKLQQISSCNYLGTQDHNISFILERKFTLMNLVYIVLLCIVMHL